MWIQSQASFSSLSPSWENKISALQSKMKEVREQKGMHLGLYKCKDKWEVKKGKEETSTHRFSDNPEQPMSYTRIRAPYMEGDPEKKHKHKERIMT